MVMRWLRASIQRPALPGPVPGRPAPQPLLLLASTTAAAEWLADALLSHPQWRGALHRLGHGGDPQTINLEPMGSRAILVVRHPALEAIEALLQGKHSPTAPPPPGLLEAWRSWQRRLGGDLLVVPVAGLIDGRHHRQLRQICRHLQLPARAEGWHAASQEPPVYEHGLARSGGWQFGGDGLRCGDADGPAVDGKRLAELLQASDGCLQQIFEAGLLPASARQCWTRISHALKGYAITAERGRSSFWISSGDGDADLAAGVIGGRGAGGAEQTLAARLGRTARWSRFEPPLRLYATYLENSCRIAAFSYVVDSFLYATHVGRYCSIGRACEIGQHDHPTTWLSTHPFQYSTAIGFEAPGFAFARLAADAVPGEARWRQFSADVGYRRHTQIGHDVWIGARVFVRKGVSIGNGAVIGAGSVVTRDIPAYAIALGSPARVLRYRFEEPIRHQLDALAWWRYAPWSLNDVPWNRPLKAIRLLQRWQRTGEVLPYGGPDGEAG